MPHKSSGTQGALQSTIWTLLVCSSALPPRLHTSWRSIAHRRMGCCAVLRGSLTIRGKESDRPHIRTITWRHVEVFLSLWRLCSSLCITKWSLTPKAHRLRFYEYHINILCARRTCLQAQKQSANPRATLPPTQSSSDPS